MFRPSRRELIQAGGLAALGLTLPEYLQASASNRKPKSCIFVYQYGGLSQLDSWDPKPNAPAEQRGPYKPIATRVPGFQVGELMPRLAGLADKYAVLRSMTHTVPIHDIANKMLLAGQANPAADAPAFGSTVTKLLPTAASVPPYVWLQKFGGGSEPPEKAYLTGGFLGTAHSPLLIGSSYDDNLANPKYRVRAFDDDATLTRDRVDSRRELLAQLDPHNPLQPHREKAFELIAGTAARQAFDLERESERTRDRYGRNPLGQNLLLARRLIEAGVRLVSVVAWCGLKPTEKFMSIETWDMHGNGGVGIFEDGWNGLGFALPRCDQGMSALLDDLTDRGRLDDTLVVLIGEFGRTPRITPGGSKVPGRDHWPHCYSAMIAGAGVKGGTVYGASDRVAAYVKDNPVSLEDFTATLYAALGIDPATRLSPDGFTRPASLGAVIPELLS
jgi:uncharacterized protein (DUF1501 family)